MQQSDKSRLSRVKNTLEKWNEKYLTNSSPFITEKYRRACINYNEVVNELKLKYKGHQLDFEL